MNEIIRSLEREQLRSDIPNFNVGDTVRVYVKVVEGSRERLQAFEGAVIARRNGPRNVHRPPCFLRHRRGAHLPVAQPPRGPH